MNHSGSLPLRYNNTVCGYLMNSLLDLIGILRFLFPFHGSAINQNSSTYFVQDNEFVVKTTIS